MDIILLVFIVIACVGIKFSGRDYYGDYISKRQTNAINGIFVVLVFFSHFSGYIDMEKGDKIYHVFSQLMGQLIVVTFLFYSGYGMMTSILFRGKCYIQSIPSKRLFKVWYHFALAVVLFLISNFIIGKTYDLRTTLLAFTGLTSIGNSNWYIFAVLCLYVFVYISFGLFRNERAAILFVVLLCGLYIGVFAKVIGYGSWWYNTILTYPAGMIFAIYKGKIENFIRKNIFTYWSTFAAAVLMFCICFRLNSHIAAYEMMSIVFVMMIVLACMKVRIGNPVLDFLGKYTFEIYILQRIPMRMIKEHIENTYVLFAVCFAVTLVLAVGFKTMTLRTDSLIYGKNKAG